MTLSDSEWYLPHSPGQRALQCCGLPCREGTTRTPPAAEPSRRCGHGVQTDGWETSGGLRFEGWRPQPQTGSDELERRKPWSYAEEDGGGERVDSLEYLWWWERESYCTIVKNISMFSTFSHLFSAWAEKRHYYTSRAARLDTYRAGQLQSWNNIVQYFHRDGIEVV